MKKLYFVILFLFVVKLVSAQGAANKTVSVNYNQAGIDAVVMDLESQTGYHFYYDRTQFDSLKVTLQISDSPLATVLNMAFNHTPFRFLIMPESMQVFLTKSKTIHTQLASGYFYTKPPDAMTLASASAAATENTNPDKDEQSVEATTENKIYQIGIKTNNIEPGNSTLSGYVKDIKSDEPIVGATIFITNSKTGVVSDQFGYFTIKLPRGRQTLTVHGIGMRDTHRQVILYSDGKLNIEMQEQVYSLKEVKISADKVSNVRSNEMGVNHLDIKSIKQIPAIFGEADILRAVLTLPGVQSVGESTTGFNVRGGAADQNLILLNDQTIYNPSHFFGFFSAFDPDMVKDVVLYKSSIPEKYGGRLASVLDVTDREGNKKKFTGSAGIGLLTSRINLEGPIIENKTSFIFGARTTYSDWLLSALPQEYKNSEANFYDVNLGISHQIDDKNNLYINAYMSHDGFKLNSDTTYKYGNKNANIKWKHNFSDKLFSVFLVGYDRYQYEVSSDENPVNGYNLNYNINQSNFKADFTYYINRKNTISFGLSSIYYKFHEGDFEPYNNQSLIAPEVIPAEQALESALYLGDKYDITPDFTIDLGVRYSIYNYLGPQTVDTYAPNLPKTSENIVDSTNYSKGKVINTYTRPEIRASARYNLNDNTSLKASYNTLTQYIHLLSNTTAISPTDVYKLSDPNIKPQYGEQVSLGLYKNAQNNTIEMSVEAYYKWIQNYLDYKSGAVLLLDEHIAQDVINDQGKAYGVELLLKKTEGKLNGWLSYTYSRTFLKQDDPNAGELINNGNYYPANYDKPNDVNFTGNYRFTHRYSISLNVVYSTGRPITLPIAKYVYDGAERVYYSDRNEYRIPDYFRTDLSINIDGNHKVHQLTHNSWSIGVYNLTGRANAYSTYFTEQGGSIYGYQLSIFAKPIPFINYNIRF